MGLTLNLVALEILAVNLFTTHQCSKKRFTTLTILILYGLFTLLVMGLLQWVLKPMLPTPLGGEGIYLIVGLFYFIPISVAYDQSFRRTALIMFTAWIYTTVVNAFSGRLASYFPSAEGPHLLIIQTALLVITFGFFITLIRKRFLYMVSHADENTVSTSLFLSVIWFLVVWLLNLDFRLSSPLVDLSIMVLLAMSIFLTYLVFHALTLAEESRKAMANLTLHDELTGLRNREALRKDMVALLQKAKPFTVVFLDLDRFKSINDDHGHAEGDRYLKRFSKHVETNYSPHGTLYRMSGDEFVLIHTNPDNARLCREIEALQFNEREVPSFLGVSVGCAMYPTDATTVSELLHIADMNMYQVKKKRHASQAHAINHEDD